MARPSTARPTTTGQPPDPGAAASRCRLTLRVGATDYRVRPVPRGDLGPGVLRAWRLRKLDDDARHVVAEAPDGPTCDCPDSVYRRRDFKHIRAMKTVGLLQ